MQVDFNFILRTSLRLENHIINNANKMYMLNELWLM